MQKDNLIIGTEARDKLISGVRRCAQAIGGTMGTSGYNGLIEAIERPGHLLTNDGITILQSISFADPLEDMGRKILLEAVARSNKASGDGSSTCVVLTAAILEEGLKRLTEASPMEIKRSLEECLPLIEDSINKQKREITVDEVGKVASISAEDEQIGAMIQEIYQKIGKTGIIHWDISKTFEDHYTIGNGITVDGAGLASPYMGDWATTGEILSHAKLKNPQVLLTKEKITSASDFNTLFSTMNSKGMNEVVVFCDDFDVSAFPSLIKLRTDKGFRTLMVKMPVLWKDWWYEDLSKVTGATIIDPIAGLSNKKADISHLGQIDNITVTKDTTFIDGMKDVSEHIKALEDDGSDDAKLRVSRLNTKTARYFVGAPSDSALSYKRLKVEDAIAAAYQALQNGVVAGGGLALLNATINLKPTVGGKIMTQALVKPMSTIYKNSNGDLFKPTFFDKLLGTQPKLYFGGTIGFDSRTGKTTDMFSAGIIDPANVVLNAVRNAISVAASILTASVVVQLPRQDPAEFLLQALSQRNMPQ